MRISYRNLTTYILQAANYRSTIPPSGGFRSIPASSSAAVQPPISSNRIPRSENVLLSEGCAHAQLLRHFHMTHMSLPSKPHDHAQLLQHSRSNHMTLSSVPFLRYWQSSCLCVQPCTS